MKFVVICRPPQSFVIVRVSSFSQKIRCPMRGQNTLIFVTTLFVMSLLVVTLLLVRLA